MNLIRTRLPFLVLACSLLFLGLAMSWRSTQRASADHFAGFHANNFHACGPLITYTDTSWSTGVVSQLTMDNYFNTAFEQGWGWDSLCGNKIQRGTGYVQAYVASASYVNSQCGGSVLSCVVGYVNVGGHEYYFWVFFRDTAFRDYPLHLTNHEFGHIMSNGDHTCEIYGVMDYCDMLQWPEIHELDASASRLIWGP